MFKAGGRLQAGEAAEGATEEDRAAVAEMLADLNELLDVRLPDDDWETVGGFLFGTLEHVPDEGESVPFDGWTLRGRAVATIVAGRVKYRLGQ